MKATRTPIEHLFLFSLRGIRRDIKDRDRQRQIAIKTRLLLNALQPARPTDGTLYQIAYFSQRDSDQAAPRYTWTPTGYVQAQKRVRCKTGRFFSRQLYLNSGTLKDTTIAQMAEDANAYLFGNEYRFQIDSGQQICKNYQNKVGTGSCETGGDGHQVQFYADNPLHYGQLICTDPDGIQGRAMLLTLDRGCKMLDRIYTSRDSIYQRMIEHAKQNGWIYREESGDLHEPDGTHIRNYDGICITGAIGTYVPYQDTLTDYRYNGDGTTDLKHYYCEDFDCNSGRLRCVNCGTYLNEEDAYSAEGDDDLYCSECFSEHFCYCELCQQDKPREDFTRTQADDFYCDDCIEYHFTKCDDCNEYVRDDDIETETTNGRDICEQCRDDGYFYCEDCNQYAPNDEATMTRDGEEVCERCAFDNYFTCDDCNERCPNEEQDNDNPELCNDCAETARTEEREGLQC